MTYPTDEETFAARNTPEFIAEGHLNSIQQFLKRIQDFLGYGGRVSDKYGIMVPPGVIWGYGGDVAPSGFLLCDGRDYLRAGADYVDLFAVIGTRNGTHHADYFNVPDYRGVTIRGWSGIPAISFVPGDVDVGDDKILMSAYSYRRSSIPVRFTTDDTLPPPLAINTTYYTIPRAVIHLSVAINRANSLVGTRVTLTGAGVGTSYVHPYLEEDKDSRVKLSAGGDSGDNLGSYQPDMFDEHSHTRTLFLSGGTPVASYSSIKAAFTAAGSSNYPTNLAGGSETRSRNVYANFIIKR